MGSDLDMLAQFSTAVAETFEDVDNQLAASLTAPPPLVATPSGRPGVV